MRAERLKDHQMIPQTIRNKSNNAQAPTLKHQRQKLTRFRCNERNCYIADCMGCGVLACIIQKTRQTKQALGLG